MARRGLPTGVQKKHSRSCATRTDPEARCRCSGGYQVQAGPRNNRQTRTFATVDAAVAWKRDVDTARAAGRLSGERAPTLREAAEHWHADAMDGIALARGRKRFKPGTLKDYRRNLEADLLPDYGAVRLDDLGARLDGLVTELQRRGLAASTVRNMLMPLRAIYRHAVRMKWVTVNPTLGLEVPTGSGRRTKVVPALQIASYLAALALEDRALWATAFYAGLRRGELMALRWRDVDLAAGLIRIDRELGAYDQKTKTMQGPKSAAGARRVPVSGDLRDLLLDHRARAGVRPSGLVFARGALAGFVKRKENEALPFNDSTTGQRAHKAFIGAGLPPVTLHDARHTFASLAIAAKAVFNPKLLQQIMGHSSIQVTYDRYGHLFPGQEAEVGVMLDDFLGAAARPVVAEVWSRLRDALGEATAQDARPVVAEALEVLSSWRREDADGGSLPSDLLDMASTRQRAVRIQRGPSGRESR
jgi:integrase